jgi:pseudouridine-5'-phosphate glycosidase
MPIPDWLDVNDEVREAIGANKPVVALESTLIAHGLPWPANRETAVDSEAAARAAGAIPATIAVWRGRPTIGITGADRRTGTDARCSRPAAAIGDGDHPRRTAPQ